MNQKLQGPLGLNQSCSIDPGTNIRSVSPSRGPIGCSESVEKMSLEDRFEKVLFMTATKLPGQIRDEFLAFLTPTNIAITVGVLAVWAGSHYFGVGFVIDIILLVAGAIMIGWQILSSANDLYQCVKITWSARTLADLDRAATHLADFITVVGVTVFIAIISKGAKRPITNLSKLAKERAYYMKVLGWSRKPQGVLEKLDDAIGFFRRNGDEIRQFEGGLSQETMNKYIKGIDFSDTVIVKRLDPSATMSSIYGNSNSKLKLIQYTDQYQTNFYTVPGTSAGNLAIPDFDTKKFRVYEVVGEFEVLITKTAPMDKNLAGGAYQIIIPNPEANLRLVRSGLE